MGDASANGATGVVATAAGSRRRGPTGGVPGWALAAALASLAVVVAPRLPAPIGPTATEAALGFVSLVVESLPFLAGGAVLAAWAQRLPPSWIATMSARHPLLAPVVAPFVGTALPLCDCGLVPLARQLHGASAGPSVINAFVAGAPLTNPIVILSTVVAFPGRPDMVLGRVAVGVGVAWIAAWAGPRVLAARDAAGEHEGHDHGPEDACAVRQGLLEAVGTELRRSGPTLVVGALLAGTFKALVPTEVLVALDRQPLLGAMAMMALAFLLAICSQADAFVAAALPVGPLPRLAFLVLGPMLDLRLAALYRRELGTRWVVGYALTITPAVLVLATLWTTWGPT